MGAFAPQIVAGVLRAHGDGNDDPACQSRHGLNGGAHRSARGQAVVDENDGFPLERNRRLVCTIEALTEFDFSVLTGNDGIEDVSGQAEFADDFRIEDQATAACDCAHCQFFGAGSSQFAHDEDVEGQLTGVCHLIGNGDTTAWQPQHNGVEEVRFLCYALRKQLACVPAVGKFHWKYPRCIVSLI